MFYSHCRAVTNTTKGTHNEINATLHGQPNHRKHLKRLRPKLTLRQFRKRYYTESNV